MDWFPLVTLLVGSAVSLATVFLTQGLADRRETRRERGRREGEAVKELRTEARRVSDLFLAESIAYERISGETVKGGFDAAYEAHLFGETLYRLGQAINMLPNAAARGQLRLIVNNLSDQSLFPDVLGVRNWQLTVPLLLNTAGDIASAYARGEEPDLDGSKWYRRIEAASARVDAEVARSKAMHPSTLAKQYRGEESTPNGD